MFTVWDKLHYFIILAISGVKKTYNVSFFNLFLIIKHSLRKSYFRNEEGELQGRGIKPLNCLRQGNRGEESYLLWTGQTGTEGAQAPWRWKTMGRGSKVEPRTVQEI